MATIYDVLERLRASAISEADKGAKFERLMKAYLRTDPVYAEQFTDVWLWTEYPKRAGRGDTGIDLVARDKDTGHYVAVQCKFFAPGTSVSKPMIDSFLATSGKAEFRERIIVSTSDKWNANAEDAIEGQAIPVRRIGVPDLEASRVDWSRFSLDAPEDLTLTDKKEPRDYQQVAINKVVAGFSDHDRGKLIMACGTGKTFTTLKLAEEHVGPGGKVLFLLPSINLLSQTIREWVANAAVPIHPVAVCSDPKSAKKVTSDAIEDISVTDLALPATTDVAVLTHRIKHAEGDTSAMLVVFATYQSIDVVAQAQKGQRAFALIVADEAHRTTGATLAGESESAFVRVHDNTYLPAAKRIYMTATPRIYDDSTKTKAGEANAVLASMDDERLFGPEFHRLGFGEAVERELLTDYKVLVLTVNEESVARTFQRQLSDDSNELKLDDAAKIVGCWNGLAKRGHAEHSFEPDVRPMRRAIAFAGQIKDSKRVEELFQSVTDYYVAATEQDDDGASPLKCSVEHVDGTMNALERNRKLDWLKDEPADGSCRILTNARCLSEGVDVPALDAVMFLSPRKSVVDIVQSVGRVMRLDEKGGKKFGYIILPIGIPSGMTPEESLKDNKRYAVVWEVLQALRAHDERFDALVNRISLSTARDEKVNVIGVGGTKGGGWEQGGLDLMFPDLDQWRDAIYAKIVQKVGSREYWSDWAKEVARIAERQITRITALLNSPGTGVRDEFDAFLDGLRGNLNESITETDAIEMLAQHLITRPVFNALFDGDEFLDNNPVAQTMERMLAELDQHDLEAENEALHKFYDSVRRKVADVKDREGRQELVRRLYDTFFSTAFKKTSDKLGIVYTPVQIVDFVLRSADEVLRKEFDQSLSDPGVHILDGFAGTGTFVVRLLELGLIEPHDLARKYAEELHANEILLLAYYIAAVNIETTYLGMRREQDAGAGYESFPGLILTDTFQSSEDDDRPDLNIFPENNDRLDRLKALPITVIVGNPPYSSGQDSANEGNQNETYPSLDAAIRRDFSSERGRGGNNSLYDSYIRAIKWASLRIAGRGVIGFVTNGGFLRSSVGQQMRRSLASDFSSIYIYNLRGYGLIAGEEGRREGRPLFEFGGRRADGSEIKNAAGGSRAAIAIVLLVMNPTMAKRPGIHYSQVPDYLSAGQKIQAVADVGSFARLDTTQIEPDQHGDWFDQRTEDFGTYLPVGAKHGDDKDGPTVFSLYGRGLETGRDAWVYQSSETKLAKQVERTVRSFNRQVDGFAPVLAAKPAARGEAKKRLVSDFIDLDSTQISWTLSLKNRLGALRRLTFDQANIVVATYRPFFRQRAYFDAGLNHIRGQTPKFFPTADHPNFGFVVTGVSSHAPFGLIMVDSLPDLHVLDTGQFFGRWRYEAIEEPPGNDAALFSDTSDQEVGGYRRIDNVTDNAFRIFKAAHGEAVTRDDVFYYVYGLLHSAEYREAYAADLKKVLPRIPLVDDPLPFVRAGRDLSDLHLTYESVDPYPLDGLDTDATGDPYDFFAVQKMAFAKKGDGAAIRYNDRITLSGIPADAHRYMLGSRSAIEWIIDRYQSKTEKASGIVNDPNEWSREVGDPRYIVDLLAKIVTVSLRTMQIVDGLPQLAIRQEQRPA